MNAAQIANVAHIHAEYVLEARRLEASADRHGLSSFISATQQIK
jgi:hypothetical protein